MIMAHLPKLQAAKGHFWDVPGSYFNQFQFYEGRLRDILLGLFGLCPGSRKSHHRRNVIDENVYKTMLGQLIDNKFK